MAGQCARKANGDEEGFTPTCLPGTRTATGCLDVWAIGDDAWKARAPAIEDVGRWRRRKHGGVTDYFLLFAHMRTRWEIPRCRVQVKVLFDVFSRRMDLVGWLRRSIDSGGFRGREMCWNEAKTREERSRLASHQGCSIGDERAVALFGAICRASCNYIVIT